MLICASWKGYLDVVKLLIEKNAKIDVKDKQDWGTAMMYASEFGHIDIVQVLLSNNADVNANNSNKHTALMHASNRGHVQIVKVLLANKANVDMQAYDSGYTALSVCCMYWPSRNRQGASHKQCQSRYSK